MAVYVDSMNAKFGRMIMCHMVSDSLEELHAMAEKIGMKREWFQDKGSMPHYDVSRSRKALAIKYGAIEIDREKLVEVMNQYRNSATTRRKEGTHGRTF
jgi:predicted transglutaminase-like protease